MESSVTANFTLNPRNFYKFGSWINFYILVGVWW